MAVSLQSALDQLRSERIKDRQDGLALVVQIFGDPLNVANLDRKGDGKAWLKTFQSLFTCVLLEKSVCLKKASIKAAQPVALARLRDSSYAVRQLVERAVLHLNRRVIKAIVSHLVQMFSHLGAVFQPVSMSYLKALSAILQFRPHVDQLEVDEWTAIAELCFNVLLDEDLTKTLDEEEEEWDAHGQGDAAEATRSHRAQPPLRALGLEDVEHMVCLQHLVSSSMAPLLTEQHYGLRFLGRYAAFLERYPVECSSHLPALFGLNKLLRELELNQTVEVIRFAVRTWRTLSSLWPTKNKQLKEQLVVCWRILVPLVSSCLAPTFDGWTNPHLTLPAVQVEVRMMLIDLHRAILHDQESRWGSRPVSLASVRLRTSDQAPTGRSRRAFELVTARQGAAFSEADAVAWAILELNATTLVGLLSPPATQLQPCRGTTATQAEPTSRAASVVDDAETLAMSMAISPSKRTRSGAADLPAAKRRRTGTDAALSQTGSALIASLVGDLQQSASRRTATRTAPGQADRLWRLQLALFLAGHWAELDGATQDSLVGTIVGLAGESDAEIQSWAFVCLAEMAKRSTLPSSRTHGDGAVAAAAFSQAWTLACRRLPSASVSRAAAHLSSTLLRCAFLPQSTVLADLRPILVEIDIQGPTLLCDSSAGFVVAALDCASKDSQLFSLNCRSRALSWLLSVWQPGVAFGMGQVPPRSCDIEWSDVLALLSSCIGDSAIILSPPSLNVNVKHTAISSCIDDELQFVKLRAYLLFQDVNQHRSASSNAAASSAWSPASVQQDNTLPQSVPGSTPLGPDERRICSILERSVLSANALWASGPNAATLSEKSFAKTCSPEQASTLLELALLAVAVLVTLAEKGFLTPSALADAAAKLLNHSVSFALFRHDWTQAERLEVLRAFSSLLPPGYLDSDPQQGSDDELDEGEELIVRAGPRSGVRETGAVTMRQSLRLSTGRVSKTHMFLTSFWQALMTAQGLKPLLDTLYAALQKEIGGAAHHEASQGGSSLSASLDRRETCYDNDDEDDDEDGFIGRARVASQKDTRAQRGDSGAVLIYSQQLVALCVSLSAEAPKLAAASDEATHDERLVNLMFEGTLDSLVKVGPSLVQTVGNGSLWLTQRDLGDLLDQIGSDLLTSYHFARDQEARCLAIDLVVAMMPTWLGAKRVSADLLDKLRKLCTFFTEQVTKQKWRSPWKVRLRVAHFLALYLRADPQERLWTDEDDELLTRCPASEAVLYLNGDRDVRIRAAGAVASAHLFDHLEIDDDGFAALYEKLKLRLPVDHAGRESVATRLLCLTNVTIASSLVRRIALFHLLEVYIATGLLEATLKAAFEGISARLGFSGPRDLYRSFAGQLTWFSLKNSYDPLKIPHKVLGFRSRKECIEHTFREIGSILLAANSESGRTFFATLTRMARKTLKEGVRECLPFLAASELGFAASEIEASVPSPRTPPWQQVLDSIAQWYPDAEPSQTLEMLTSIADQLVTVLLTMFFEPASSTSFPENLQQRDGKAYATFLQLSQQPAGAVKAAGRCIVIHEPNRPFFSATTIYEAILILRGSGVDTLAADVAYHVLRQMLFRIGNAPFVNDQHRYFEATKLYISMCADTIASSPLLLDVVLQGVAFLVEQPHVQGPACSLASWAIAACAQINCLPTRLASTLTAFAVQTTSTTATPDGVGVDHRRHPTSTGLDVPASGGLGSAHLGVNLRTWAESVVAQLPPSSDAVQLTLLLWPDAIPDSLAGLASPNATPKNIASALQRCPDAVVTAAVLERMRASLKAASADERNDFARSTIWLLFDRLKPPDGGRQPVDDLARNGKALSEILSICEGRLRTPDLDALQDLSSSELHGVLRTVSRLKEQSRGIQAVAILVILQHLQGRSIFQSENAYMALRGILSAAKTTTSALAKWPGHAYEELSVLAEFEAFEPSATIRSAKELEDVTLLSSASDFEVWIRRVTGIISHLLIKTSSGGAFYHHLQSLVEGEVEIAARLLPALMHLYTADDGFEGVDEMVKYLDGRREAIALHFQDVLTSDGSDSRAWAAIIEGLLHVRRWRVPDNDPTYSDLWYSIDFLLLARRSLDCKMYTAALLFIELFFEHSTDSKDAESKQGAISALLYEVYSNVEDPDGFYGIVNADVYESLTRRLHHEGQWHRALQLHAAEYETSVAAIGSKNDQSGAMIGTAFHMLGFNRLASTIDGRNRSRAGHGNANSTSMAGVAAGDDDFDMAWRTGAWDLPCSAPYQPGTSRGTFATLRALHRDRSGASIDQEGSRCFARELGGLAGAKPEAINEVRKVQLDLLSLHEVQSWRQLVSQLGVEEAIVHVGAFWVEPRPKFDIECYERVLSVRQSMLQAERTKDQLNEIGNMLSPIAEESMKLERAMMIQLSAAARKQGRLQTSINAIAKAQKLHSCLVDTSNHTDEEFASVLWAQDEHAFALEALTAIIEAFQVGESSASRLRYRKAVLMARLGEWRATARSQQPRMIDTTLFKPALELMVAQNIQTQGTEEQAKVAYKWAKFADEQYRGVDVEEIDRLKVYIDRRKEEIRQNQVESDKTGSRSLKQRLMQFQRQAEKILRQDESHLRELESARTLFLQRAIAMYSRSLTMSDRYDDAVGRLTSLWFDNSFDENANMPLSAALTQIPSHKFIPLTHQLSARLSSSPKGATKGMSMFQQNLANLVLRICKDHPFHTCYALFALLKAGKDAKASETSTSSRDGDLSASQVGVESSQRQRSVAAEFIWARVKATDRLKRRFQLFEEVCQAYVEWAEVNLAQRFSTYFTPNGTIKKGPLRMPPASELRIARLRDVDIPVATANVPIDRTCEYQDVVSIVRYSETFTTAGGIHLPKINECIGSDGKRYKQLFKRDDDLRQDAVMQQVFRLVNGLLDKDRRASQRQLTVRTYAVIPLGPQCGLLEFVTNTVPIGEILIRMHGQYGPNDMSPIEARTRIREAQGLTASQKLDVFLNVCERMPPAFRFFFTERRKDPPSWFAMRLNYTRSAATTSIVGHILGLGDRHVSNILLDKQSGELVHIDFGVAFDQGKLLPIPELVPFRLTRDLVDGMGLSGIEGTYRRCCEETLRVLRDGRDVVKTVLEVFKHDPLFAWTSNPIKVLKAQGAAGGEEETSSESISSSGHGHGRHGRQGRVSAPSVEPQAAAAAAVTSLMTIDTAELSADRAVSSVMKKLSSSLSIEYTVNELIQQAMDAGNLSSIFQGWQAAL